MNRITIIGLGLVGNSLGMALKRAASTTVGDQSQPPALGVRVVGFDPSREAEGMALRRFGSVDEIAPDLKRAVEGSQLVVLAVPAEAVREVLATVAPFLPDGATVTDVLPTKAAVLALAGELLGPRGNFVGGHPLSRSVDISTAPDTALPSPDLFVGAPYSIIPLPGASNESLNRVIWLAEVVGAQPLFVDALEHDSFMAAASQLPILVAAALLNVTVTRPTWGDMSVFSNASFEGVAGTLAQEPGQVTGSMLQNRAALVRWVDEYLLALQELRDSLASSDEAFHSSLQGAYEANSTRLGRGEGDKKLQQELNRSISDASPMRGFMGSYLSDRIFRKRGGGEG